MKLLLKAFLIAILVQILLTIPYALITKRTLYGDGNEKLIYLIIAGSFFLNFAFTILIIPGRFIAMGFKKNQPKLVAYFLVPVLILVLIIVNAFKLQTGDYEFYLIAIIAFILAHVYVLSKDKFILQ